MYITITDIKIRHILMLACCIMCLDLAFKYI